MSQPPQQGDHTRSDDLDGVPVGADGQEGASSAPRVSHHAFAHAAATRVVRPPPAPVCATVTAGAHAKSSPSTAGVHAKSTLAPFSARGAIAGVPRPCADVPYTPSSATSKAPGGPISKGIASAHPSNASPSSAPCASKYGVNSKSAPASGPSSLLPGMMVDFKAPAPVLPGAVAANSKAPSPPMMHGTPHAIPSMPPQSMLPGNPAMLPFPETSPGTPTMHDMPQAVPSMPSQSMLPGNAAPSSSPQTTPGQATMHGVPQAASSMSSQSMLPGNAAPPPFPETSPGTPTMHDMPQAVPSMPSQSMFPGNAAPPSFPQTVPGQPTMHDIPQAAPCMSSLLMLPGNTALPSFPQTAPGPPTMHDIPQTAPSMSSQSTLPGNAALPSFPQTTPALPSATMALAPPPIGSHSVPLPGMEPTEKLLPEGSGGKAQLPPGVMMPDMPGVPDARAVDTPLVWPTPPLALPTTNMTLIPGLGMIPLPGMAPLTVPNIPPVPGMPTIPFGLGPTIPSAVGLTAQIPKVDIPVEKWEEFEAEEYGIMYFYNRSKDVSVWEAPEGCKIIRAKKVHIGLVDSWETVGDKNWVRVKTTTGLYYFHNKESDDLKWECPAEIVDLVKALDEKGEEQEFEIPDDDSEPEFEIPKEDPEVASSSDASDSESSESPEMKEILALRKKLEDFQELLREKGIVSGPMHAFTYERAIPKLCNDPRFLVIANNERRSLFDSTVKKLKESMSKDTAKKRSERINQFRKLLQEEEVHRAIQQQCREPLDIILMSLDKKVGDDPRWKALDLKERKRVTQEAVEKIAIDVEAMRKIEREKFGAQVEAYFARCKKDELPVYIKAREDLGSLVYFTDQEQERIYHTFLVRRREVLNTRSKRQRELQETHSELEAHRLKRKRLEDDDELVKLLVEKCKNPWAPKASWKDYVDKSKLDRSKEELEALWSKFKQKVVDQRQRLFLQQLRATFDREKTFNVNDIKGVVKELNIPALSCVPEKYLADVMQQFDEEVTKDTELAFTQYLKTCGLFGNVDALETRGPVFAALLSKLSTNTLYKRLDSRPKEREEIVRAWIEEVKKIKASSKIVLEE